tara:strand:- start:3 stop:278 length:276 start_codon:yes stop_codon:yes gene_type:complete
MKPQLVDLNEIFKDNSSLLKKEQKIKIKKTPPKNIEYDYNSLFNFIGLLFLILGLYFLNRRKREKEKRRTDFEDRIYKLKDIIKNNNEFIL